MKWTAIWSHAELNDLCLRYWSLRFSQLPTFWKGLNFWVVLSYVCSYLVVNFSFISMVQNIDSLSFKGSIKWRGFSASQIVVACLCSEPFLFEAASSTSCQIVVKIICPSVCLSTSSSKKILNSGIRCGFLMQIQIQSNQFEISVFGMT